MREYCRRHDVTLKVESRLRAFYGTHRLDSGVVSLAVPTTFMNESGAAVVPLISRAALDDVAHLVIIHDELDLEPGRLQLKRGGGLAGHNGLRSVAGSLGTSDFTRLRIGIGRPERKEQVTDWVLRRLSGAHQSDLVASVERGVEALDDLVRLGIDGAQARINGGG